MPNQLTDMDRRLANEFERLGLPEAARVVERSAKNLFRWFRRKGKAIPCWFQPSKLSAGTGERYLNRTGSSPLSGLSARMLTDIRPGLSIQNHEQPEHWEDFGHQRGHVEQLIYTIERLGSDNDRIRADEQEILTQLQRVQTQLADAERARSESEGANAELQKELRVTQLGRIEVAEELSSMRHNYVELEQRSAESIAAAQTSLETTTALLTEASAERDHLANESKLLRASMSPRQLRRHEADTRGLVSRWWFGT